jgi:hypothetical protein
VPRRPWGRSSQVLDALSQHTGTVPAVEEDPMEHSLKARAKFAAEPCEDGCRHATILVENITGLTLCDGEGDGVYPHVHLTFHGHGAVKPTVPALHLADGLYVEDARLLAWLSDSVQNGGVLDLRTKQGPRRLHLSPGEAGDAWQAYGLHAEADIQLDLREKPVS